MKQVQLKEVNQLRLGRTGIKMTSETVTNSDGFPYLHFFPLTQCLLSFAKVWFSWLSHVLLSFSRLFFVHYFIVCNYDRSLDITNQKIKIKLYFLSLISDSESRKVPTKHEWKWSEKSRKLSIQLEVMHKGFDLFILLLICSEFKTILISALLLFKTCWWEINNKKYEFVLWLENVLGCSEELSCCFSHITVPFAPQDPLLSSTFFVSFYFLTTDIIIYCYLFPACCKAKCLCLESNSFFLLHFSQMQRQHY